jgi:hypothetical protein
MDKKEPLVVMLREVAASRIQASQTILSRSTRRGLAPKEDSRTLTRQSQHERRKPAVRLHRRGAAWHGHQGET